MQEYVEKIRTMLKAANIHYTHLEDIFNDNLESKAEINGLLGLDEANDHRKILDIALTEREFAVLYPFVRDVFGDIEGWQQPFRPISGKIIVGRDKVNITKFLSKQLAAGAVPEGAKHTLMKGLHIDPADPKAEAQIVPKFGEILTAKGHKVVVISTNPFDFFTGSAGEYGFASFKSCFRPGGEYFNGCNSLARDKFSTIVYSADRRKLDYKNGRAWMFILEHVVAQTKTYGTFTDNDRQKARKYAVDCIASKSGIDPTMFNHYLVERWKNADGRNVLYFDDYSIDVEYLKDEYPTGFHGNKAPNIAFSRARCLKCGRETQYPQAGVCGVCSGAYYECSSCHNEVFKGQCVSIGNAHLCITCAEKNYYMCVSCGKYHAKGTETILNEGKVCKDCLKRYYYKCNFCGVLHHSQKEAKVTMKDSSEVWCMSCFQEHGFICNDCDGSFANESKHKLVGSTLTLCGTCAQKYSVCPSCGKHFLKGGTTSDGIVCEKCFTTYDYCTHCHTHVPAKDMTFDGEIVSCLGCATKRWASGATHELYEQEVADIMSTVNKTLEEKIGSATAQLLTIKESRDKTGFLVGDIVRVTQNKTFHEFPIGSLITLCGVAKNQQGENIWLVFKDGIEWFITREEVEFARPPMVPGDTIKIGKAVKTITGISHDIDCNYLYICGSSAFSSDVCIPDGIIDSSALQVINYRVGDLLEIMSDNCKHGFAVGAVVEIYKVDNLYRIPRYFARCGQQQGCIWGSVDVKAYIVQKAK